jgi:DNA-directed RNA polymerase subunit L
MPSKIKYTLVEKSKSIDGYGSNFLKFKLSGPDINYVIVNTLSRIGLSLLGSFSWNPEYITIEANTSIFNQDQMKLRISNIPIINSDYANPIVPNGPELVSKCIEMEIQANTSIFSSKKDSLQELEEIETKKKELLNNLHMYVEARNRTNDIMCVTTNEKFTSFFLNDKKIPNIYLRETLIIKLKPGEDFICSAVADFNIPMFNSIYSPVSVFAHEEIDPNTFIITVESMRQLEEEEIVKRCCAIGIEKLESIQKIILDKLEMASVDNPNAEYDAEISIENENHTLGNLLTRGLQDHPNIAFCGYKIDHPEINELVIKYKTEGKTFSKVLQDTVKILVKTFESISSEM